MKIKSLNAVLFITMLLSGFYGGTGFFTAIGGNPAITKLSNHTFAEYWQNIDSYMAARMPMFGPVLMLSIIISIVLLFRSRYKSPAWLMLLALLILVGDLIFAFNVNFPNNRLIQSWDLGNLPANVGQIKWQVVEAFNYPMLFMMGSFVFVLLAVWTKNNRQMKHLLYTAGARDL